MFPNNNRHVIRKLTGRTLKANRTRNWIVILAISLTTFLMTSVFSIGMSYLKSYDLQQIRVMGTTAHAALTLATEEQVSKLHELAYIDTVGLQAAAEQVVIPEQWGNLVLQLFWYDETEWEKHRRPALTHLVGEYPQEENEVMIASWLLERMGITDPKLGMEIELTTTSLNDKLLEETGRFTLSGYYTEYMNVRSGNQGIILVSKAYIDRKGISVEKSGSATVYYKKVKDIEEASARLRADLQLEEDVRQKVKTVPLYQSNDSNIGLMLGFAALISFIMLSGYLLIYNVLYISVSKDIRYYGLLKTIGTTPRQIRRIVMGQALLLSAIGIPIGIVVSTMISYVLVPMALGIYSVSSTGVAVSFSPWIYAGAIAFSLLTTWVSCIKPARLAGGISPIEAVRYTGATIKRKYRPGHSGGRLTAMAVRNIFRDRKRALLVFLSLFMGITTFMAVNTIQMSLDFDHFVESYIDYDFELHNSTANTLAGGERKPYLTEPLLEEIRGIPGVTDVRAVTSEPIEVAYDAAIFNKHIEAFAKEFDITAPTEEELKQYPGMFWSYAVGIDSRDVEEINQELDTPIDIAAFEQGEIALIAANRPELYELNSKISFRLESGKHSEIVLGGFLPRNYQFNRGSLAPNIYISAQAMAKLVDEPFIDHVNIQSEDELAEVILNELKDMANAIGGITVESKIEAEEGFASMKLMLYILGGGLSLILALIGILNFLNVMFTGVTVRRQELAIMESIGMTQRQLLKMLVFEGLGYAIISSVLVLTLGNLITYGVFKLFQSQADYAVFIYPAVPMVIALVSIFAVCLIIPAAAFKSFSKESVTQRLRSMEG